MSTEDSLAQIPIFHSLPHEDIVDLARLWTPRLLKKKETLFRKGDLGSSMFVIEEGTIEITVPHERQQGDFRVSVLNTGDFLGELSLVDGMPRTANAIAMCDCRLLEMHRDDFRKFITNRPVVALSMISEIGKRLHATNDLVTSLVSKNVNVEMEERLSFGDKLADRVADLVGSWKFIIWFVVFLVAWIAINVVELIIAPFDQYPFVFLNLVLAVVASLQAPLIMMSQNRAQIKDRLRAELDYKVNVKSELMLQELHAKIDEIRSAELQLMQETLDRELSHIRRYVQSKETNGLSSESLPTHP